MRSTRYVRRHNWDRDAFFGCFGDGFGVGDGTDNRFQMLESRSGICDLLLILFDYGLWWLVA